MKLYNCNFYIPFIIMYTAKCYAKACGVCNPYWELSVCIAYKDTTCMIATYYDMEMNHYGIDHLIMPLFTSTTLMAVTVSSKKQIPCTCANWVNHLEDYIIWHPILKLAKTNTAYKIAWEQCHYSLANCWYNTIPSAQAYNQCACVYKAVSWCISDYVIISRTCMCM